MKLNKLLLGLASASCLATLVAPLTSCSKNNYNTISLKQGETANREIANSVTKVTYVFKQSNLNNATKTKVTVQDFQINGVAHSLWSGTIKYYLDSAGNILVQVNTDIIKSSMSSVDNISFKLVFTNKVAGSKHYSDTLTISFSEEKTAAASGKITVTDDSVSVAYTNTFDSLPLSTPDAEDGGLEHVYLTSDSKYFPDTITVTLNDSNKDLTAGEDYAFTTYGKTAWLTFPALPSENITVTVTMKDTPASLYYAPFVFNSNSFECQSLQNVDSYYPTDINYEGYGWPGSPIFFSSNKSEYTPIPKWTADNKSLTLKCVTPSTSLSDINCQYLDLESDPEYEDYEWVVPSDASAFATSNQFIATWTNEEDGVQRTGSFYVVTYDPEGEEEFVHFDEDL